MMETLRARIEAAWAGDGVLARALNPLALPYRAGIGLRNRLYDARWVGVQRVPARVVSVGNVLVGGTGKTPLVLWLADALRAAGRRPAIVARGYGKRRRGVVVVSEGGQPLVSAVDGGDEAVMMARRFEGPIVTGEDRVAAARLAIERFGVDTVVLDDGFQHRRLARDVDLVVMPAQPPVERLLPAGPYREPLTALGRATAVVVFDGPDAGRSETGVPRLHARVVPATLVRVEHGRWCAGPLSELAGRDVIAVTGIARPERFHATLRAAGARLRATVERPDHHAWGTIEVRDIVEQAGAALVVTTEKDLVKWTELSSPRVRALRIGVEVAEPARLLGLAVGADVLCEDSAR